MIKTFILDPVAKPRMSRSDVWLLRPCVARYRAFCDELRLQAKGMRFPEHGAWVIFRLPMPRGWSDRKKEATAGEPHKTVPDVDNLVKSIFDALETDDRHIWDVRITKVWDHTGSIEIHTTKGGTS